MSDPIESWPFHGLELVKTITSLNGLRRVRFGQRPDGGIQFFPEELSDRVDEGQAYSIWVSHPLGGIYPDLVAAEADACRLYNWIVTD